ncbi:MAG: ABC transporter permease [candidate division Zixibacteria bacterium]|nr:ABC transporter permease [candidate division Zixibacteria bacterium]
MRWEFLVAGRYFRSRHRERFVSATSFISIGGIAVGVAALLFVLSMMNGFEAEVKDRILGTTADVAIFTSGDVGLTDWQRLDSLLQSLPGFVSRAPFVYYKAAVSSRLENDGIIVRGILPEEEPKATKIADRIVAGDFSLAASPDSLPKILLGKGLAQRLGVTLGDSVLLFSLRGQVFLGGSVSPKVKKFQMSGIFETGMYEYDANLAYIHLTKAQELFDFEGRVTGLQIRLSNPDEAERYSETLNQFLPSPAYSVSWQEMHKNLFSWMSLEKYAMFVALSLIVAVAAFSIVSSLVMLVLEKKKEIGILVAMGATAQNIRFVFMTLGTGLGILGIFFGNLLGYTLAWLQYKYHIIRLPAEIYFIDFLPVGFKLADFAAVSIAAILLSFLATLYPAKKAASLPAVEAIRAGG